MDRRKPPCIGTGRLNPVMPIRSCTDHRPEDGLAEVLSAPLPSAIAERRPTRIRRCATRRTYRSLAVYYASSVVLPVDFEWDSAKDAATRESRGFGFSYAIRIFAGPTLEAPDTRLAYGEVRIRAIGQVGGDVLVVVYTDRHGIRRIISARLANRKERALWQTPA